jgi:hypothetical protein
MRMLRILVSATAMCVLTLDHSEARQKPNFSGTWTLADPKPTTRTRAGDGDLADVQRTDRSLALDNAAFACGDECTIVQTATTITVKRPPNAQGVAAPDVVLHLDGRESKNLDAGRGGGPPREYVSRARWEGTTLVTTRSLDPQGRFTTIRTIALDAGTLVIVTTESVPEAKPRTSLYTKR